MVRYKHCISFSNAAFIDTVVSVSVETASESLWWCRTSETIASIKFNAPLDYASQGRCVTAEDYKTGARQYYPNTRSVSIFGGENGSFDDTVVC